MSIKFRHFFQHIIFKGLTFENSRSNENSIALFFKSLRKITKLLNLEKGYRLICNVGDDGGQEVPHLHFHILGKKRLSGLIP